MKELIYSKFSNERDRKFAIRTDIYEEDGRRFVKKSAVYPEGEAHVRNLFRWYQELEKLFRDLPFSCSSCKEESDGVCFPYIEGETLEEFLDALIAEEQVSKAKKYFTDYLECVKKTFSIQPFVMTEKFREVFGEQDLPDGFYSASVMNIDMVCSNLVLGDFGAVLDYEWTFDFPIPVEFVLYRIIHYFVETHRASEMSEFVLLYTEFGITEEFQAIFKNMERHFQSYIEGGHIPIRELFESMTPGVAGTERGESEEFQVYFSSGEGYREEDSVKLSIRDSVADHTISLPEGCKELRLDPGDAACTVKVNRLAFDGKSIDLSCLQIPEGARFDEWLYIAKADPHILGIQVPKHAKALEVHLEIYPENEIAARHILTKMNEMHMQIRKIEQFKQTLLGRVYQKYRKLMKKGDK